MSRLPRIPAAVLVSLMALGLFGPPTLGAAGTELWTRQFGTAGSDFAYAAATDGSGNVYVAGYTPGTLPKQESQGEDDAFVRKYSAGGRQLWTRQFGTSEPDYANAAAVDAAGNVVVAGTTLGEFPNQSTAGESDVFLRKYSVGGKRIWTRQFGTGDNDEAYAVAADRAGNVYVAGVTLGVLPGQSTKGTYDAYLRKYSTKGRQLWTRQFGTTEADYAQALAIDAAGNVYVAGTTEGTLHEQPSSGGFDVYVRKYSPKGKHIWTRQFGSDTRDNAYGLAVDGSGNLLVAGHTQGSLTDQENAGEWDVFLRKYSPRGRRLWTRQFGTDQSDYGNAVAVDGSGNAFLAGSTEDSLTGQPPAGLWDAYVRKYSATGRKRWTRQFGTADTDGAAAVATDAAGAAYVAGWVFGALPDQTWKGNGDAFVRKYEGS